MMTNNTSGINKKIKVNGQKLVTSFKYKGSVVSDEGSKPEILSRVAQTAALTRLKPVCCPKIQLMYSLVTSWSIFLCASESWTLTAGLFIRCVVSCRSTSFPLLVFFYEALL